MNPHSLVNALLRHKFKICLSFVAIFGAAVAATAMMQRTYRSEGKLLVRLGRENSVVDPTATIGQGPLPAVPMTREDEINSMVEILKSRVLLEQLVDSFGPETILGASSEATPESTADATVDPDAQGSTRVRSPGVNFPQSASSVDAQLSTIDSTWWDRVNPLESSTPRDQALSRLAKRITVWAARKSNVINITYDALTPQLAQAVVGKLIDLYLDHHIRYSRSSGSHEFFTAQTQKLADQLSQAEANLRDLKNSTDLASLEEQRRILEGRVGSLQDELLRAESDWTVCDAEAAQLTATLDKLPQKLQTEAVMGHPHQAADLMRQQLYLLQIKEQELTSIFTDDAIQLKEIRRQVKEAQSLLNKEETSRTQVATGINTNHAQLELALLTKRAAGESWKAKAETLRKQLAGAREEITAHNNRALRINQLEREVAVHEASYRKFRENLEQARIDQALELERISNISIVQPPTFEARPSRPNKLLNLGLGFVFAVVGSLSLAMTVEYLNHSFRSPTEVDRKRGVAARPGSSRLRGEPVLVGGKTSEVLAVGTLDECRG